MELVLALLLAVMLGLRLSTQRGRTFLRRHLLTRVAAFVLLLVVGTVLTLLAVAQCATFTISERAHPRSEARRRNWMPVERGEEPRLHLSRDRP